MSRDGIAGLAILAASLVLFALTLDLKDNPMVPVGPGFYPRIVLALTALLSPPRGARGWASALVLGLLASFLTWLVFERYLSVLLPRGRWTGF